MPHKLAAYDRGHANVHTGAASVKASFRTGCTRSSPWKPVLALLFAACATPCGRSHAQAAQAK